MSWQQKLDAVDQLMAGPTSRKVGFDIRSKLCCAQPTITQRFKLGHVLKDRRVTLPSGEKTGGLDTYHEVIDSITPPLTKQQRSFTELVMNKDTDCLLLQGRAQSGKTTTTMAVAVALASAGVKVLVIADQFMFDRNPPIARALSTADSIWKQAATILGDKVAMPHQMVKMDGSVSLLGQSDGNEDGDPFRIFAAETEECTVGQGNEEASDNEEDNDDRWPTQAETDAVSNAFTRQSYLTGALDPRIFAQKFFDRIPHWAKTAGEGYPTELARRYQVLTKLLSKDKATNLDKVKKAQLHSDLEDTEAQLAQWYLRHEIRLIFALCTTSASIKLASPWAPDVIIVEDAGYVGHSNLNVALAAYQESMKQLILSGDYTTQKPSFPDEPKDLIWQIMSMSLFERLCRTAEKDEEGDYVVLDRKLT